MRQNRCGTDAGSSPLADLEARAREGRQGFLGTPLGSCGQRCLGVAIGVISLLAAIVLAIGQRRVSPPQPEQDPPEDVTTA